MSYATVVYNTDKDGNSVRDEDFVTRDQLVVSGLFDGEPMHFIVMHWPSRYGGETLIPLNHHFLKTHTDLGFLDSVAAGDFYLETYRVV